MTIATSIVVPTLDSPTLGATLLALAGQLRGRDDVEVIVAGSDRPGGRAALAGARYISSEAHLFPGAARNLGAATARGERLVFLDSDCLPRTGWLRALEARLGEGLGAVGGAVAFEPEQYWRRVDNVSLFHEFLPDAPAGRRPYLPSLTLAVSRKPFEAVGGFDGALRSAEDLDLTARLGRAGVPLYFESAAVVVHRPAGRTSRREVLARHRLYGGNSARVRGRHPGVLAAHRLLRAPRLLRAAAPVVALAVTARIFLREPAARPFMPWAPGVLLTKVAWCLGAAEAAD